MSAFNLDKNTSRRIIAHALAVGVSPEHIITGLVTDYLDEKADYMEGEMKKAWAAEALVPVAG
jgi:hypothetical protein